MKGEILLDGRFTAEGEGSTLATVIAQDMRAVSVRVNDVVGVAGFLLPGNHVDVVAAYRDGPDTRSETVVQNVKVLAVDQTASTDKNEPVVVRAVTLEVTPADAEKLVLAEQRGSIQLALRNPRRQRDGGDARAPSPAAAPAPAPAPVQKARPRVRTGPPPPEYERHRDTRHRRSARRRRRTQADDAIAPDQPDIRCNASENKPCCHSQGPSYRHSPCC